MFYGMSFQRMTNAFFICPVVSLEGRDLVEKLLDKDPTKRIDASKALQHPWITRRASRMTQATPQGDDDSFNANDFACVIS